jgi:GNAT superfamily N-acetyltransferase
VTLDLFIPDQPTSEHRDAIRSRLVEFNAANGHPVDSRTLAVLLKDGGGEVVGGLWGSTNFGWLFVDFLFVPEECRGQDLGLRLMTTAEELARGRGCHGSWLTTFTFQARGFYEKLGFEVFGSLDHPPGDVLRYFMRKHF